MRETDIVWEKNWSSLKLGGQIIKNTIKIERYTILRGIPVKISFRTLGSTLPFREVTQFSTIASTWHKLD